MTATRITDAIDPATTALYFAIRRIDDAVGAVEASALYSVSVDAVATHAAMRRLEDEGLIIERHGILRPLPVQEFLAWANPRPVTQGRDIVDAITARPFYPRNAVGVFAGVVHALRAEEIPVATGVDDAAGGRIRADTRAVPLSPTSISPIVCERVGVVTTTDGTASAAVLLVRRYAASPALDELVFVSTQPTHRTAVALCPWPIPVHTVAIDPMEVPS